MEANTEVPKTLSAAIRMALKDQLAVESNSKIEVDMHHWHKAWAGRGTSCEVCFAGAVMHQQLKLHVGDNMSLAESPLEWRRVFKALNAVSQGRVYDALIHMDHPVLLAEKIAKAIKILEPMPDYDDARGRFRYEMYSIAKYLEEMDL